MSIILKKDSKFCVKLQIIASPSTVESLLEHVAKMPQDPNLIVTADVVDLVNDQTIVWEKPQPSAVDNPTPVVRNFIKPSKTDWANYPVVPKKVMDLTKPGSGKKKATRKKVAKKKPIKRVKITPEIIQRAVKHFNSDVTMNMSLRDKYIHFCLNHPRSTTPISRNSYYRIGKGRIFIKDGMVHTVVGKKK